MAPLKSLSLTFFLWSDTHFGYAPAFAPADFRADIIRQLEALPGWPYPEAMGGCVEKPAFVMHAGDMLDGQQDGAYEFALYRHAMAGLRLPYYETLGNHDFSEPFLSHFRQRYGGDSYAFTAAGVRCLSVAAAYDAAETASLPPASLAFLDRELAALPAAAPLILFTHSRLDRTVNGKEALDRLAGRRVLLSASGHLHMPSAFRLNGIPGLDVGHCRNHPMDREAGRSPSLGRARRIARRSASGRGRGSGLSCGWIIRPQRASYPAVRRRHHDEAINPDQDRLRGVHPAARDGCELTEGRAS